MEISISKIDSREFVYQTGGGCGECMLNITVDSGLPEELQRETVIHEIIEMYCPFLEHSKVEELTELITDGLRQL